MSVYIDRDQLENFAMNCVGGVVTMKQIHEFPAADKIMELITLKALADAKIERLEARLEQTRWIPVSERRPANNMDVLIFYEWTGRRNTVYREVQIASIEQLENDPSKMFRPIAWMPLPEPPEEVAP